MNRHRAAAVTRVVIAVSMAAAACARPARVAPPPEGVQPRPAESATTVVESTSPQPAARTAVEQLEQDILSTIRTPGVQRGLWGIAVHSLDREQRLVDINSAALFVPASAAKIVTIATAAEAVGWDYRFRTRVLALGDVRLQPRASIEDGTLRGDILVAGSGDPSIGGRAGNDISVFVEAFQAQRIHRIEGRIIGDDDGIEEPRPQLAWAWDDLGYTSGAIFGALNLAENRMAVTIAPGAAAGLPTTLTVEPYAAARPLMNRTVTVAPGERPLLWPEQRPGETFLTIAGGIPAGAPPARMNVAVGNPTAWFATVLRDALVRAGIEVTGGAFDVDDIVPRPDRTAARELFTYTSPPLSAIAGPMLKDSINLYAEAALRLNTRPGAFPTNDAALEGLNERLAAWGVPPGAQQLIDGSGLSRRDAVSPEVLLTVLRRMHDPSGTSPFVLSLPIAGVDGSLANRMRATPAEGNVRAKTGTMSNIRSLAGYVTTRDGERLAFVALVNNFEGPGAAANQAIDAIAVRLASFTRAATAPPPSSPPASR